MPCRKSCSARGQLLRISCTMFTTASFCECSQIISIVQELLQRAGSGAASAAQLDPELVQRAVTKLQNRLIGLEKDRQAQEAFNEKQAAIITMLLERVTHLEKRGR